MLFNGIGVEKDERAAAHFFLKAAVQNNPVAQNRVARLFAAGRGVRQDLVEAMKWHMLARAAGVSDLWLDGEMVKLNQTQRHAVEAAVHQFLGR